MSLNNKVKDIKNSNSLSISKKIDKISMLYSAEGYIISLKTDNQLQMIRKKSFSFLWAFLWFLLWGVGLIVYLLYYLSKNDDTYTVSFLENDDTSLDLRENEIIRVNNNSSKLVLRKSSTSYSFDEIKSIVLNVYSNKCDPKIISNEERLFLRGMDEFSSTTISVKDDDDFYLIESYKIDIPIELLSTNTPKETNKDDSTSKLLELAKLLKDGLISKEEFEKHKKQLNN